MRVPPPPRAMVPALAAVAGVVVAHVVDYAVVFPGAGVRAERLQATGHAYWPAAVWLAVGAAAVGLALAAARGARRALRGLSPAPFHTGLRCGLPWLLACQGLAFVALEAGERAAAGLPPAIVVRSPVFWLGLLLQVPVAWLAIRLLAAVERAAFRVVGHRRRAVAVRPARALPRPVTATPMRSTAFASPGQPRAPPLAA